MIDLPQLEADPSLVLWPSSAAAAEPVDDQSSLAITDANRYSPPTRLTPNKPELFDVEVDVEPSPLDADCRA